MPYKYSPPQGYDARTTRGEIDNEFGRWAEQANDNKVVGARDYPIPERIGGTEAIVRFELRGQPKEIRVNRWESYQVNLRCCYLIIRDIRLQEARGLTDSVQQFYQQLPAGRSRVEQRNPYDVLEVMRGASLEIAEAAYRAKANRYHPDKPNADVEKFKEATDAIEQVRTAQHG